MPFVMKKKYNLLLLFALCTAFAFAQSTATYSVTFTSNWSQTAHPHPSGNLPGSAHWSKLVGATHNDEANLLVLGELASPGVKDVAELGSNGVFFSEVNAAITAGNAYTLIDGPSLGTAGGTITIDEIITTDEFPYLTLATMIAPSPDWMVALGGLSLVNGSGDWIESLEFDVYPLDAGTDSGIDYTSGNLPTNPADPISSAQGIAPFSNAPIGSILITLENVLSVDEVNQVNVISVFPNPSSGELTINSATPIKRIEIYSVLGKKVMQLENLDQTSVKTNIQGLNTGIYVLNITDSNDNTIVKKIVKN